MTTPPVCRLRELSKAILQQEGSLQAVEYEGRWISWGEMSQVADRLADLVAMASSSRDSPVALMPRSRPSTIAALLGLFAIDRSVHMIHVYQNAAGILRDMDKLRPSILVAAKEDLVPELVSGLHQRGIAAIGLNGMNASLVDGAEMSTIETDPAALQRCLHILSSGTTGTPKHISISYDVIADQMVGQSVVLTQAPDAGGELPPKYLCAPIGNISGLMGIASSVLQGRRSVVTDRFTVDSWVDYVRRYRPSLMGLPAAGIKMVFDAQVPAEDLASIRYVPTGAAPVDLATHRGFEERYDCAILLSYGATEFIGTVCAMTPQLHERWGEAKFGSVGRAMSGVTLRVVDAESGAVLEPGEEGILEVMTQRIGEQWLRTSDLVVIDQDEFMFHRGRSDGAINRGGFKVLPETVENALRSHPAILDVAVVGITDQRLGQVPAAALVLRPGVAPPPTAELERFLRDRVYATHIPANWKFVDELPRTSSLKISRGQVREVFER